MKHPQILAMLTLGLGTLMSAQTATQGHAKSAPSGTTVTKRRVNTEVQPVTKQ
jgi:hypothetical protein